MRETKAELAAETVEVVDAVVAVDTALLLGNGSADLVLGVTFPEYSVETACLVVVVGVEVVNALLDAYVPAQKVVELFLALALVGHSQVYF
jgi:hypothetical protein